MEWKYYESLRELFDDCTSRFAKNKALYFINGDGYTYEEFGKKTREISDLMCRYGIHKGDKIGIISQNMPNWAVAFFSASAFGRIAVPMLPDFSESDIKHILKHSESRALFVSEKLLPKIKEKAMDRLSLVIKIDDFSIIKGEPVENPEKEVSAEEITHSDLAAIIYTSGTTGSSKGVMLTHRNFCANLNTSQVLRPSYEWDVWLSLLPLSHTLENGICLLVPLQAGAVVYYLTKAPTPTILMKAFAEVRPTTMLSVPLIIEKIYKNAILPKFNKNFATRALYKFPPTRKVLHKIAGKELMKKFGGRMRFFGIGGAKLNEKVERFLYEAKFPYAVGYGLTETSPLLSGATCKLVRIGSVGPTAYGVKLKLIDVDPRTGIGEIVAKGENVMLGYYKNIEATEAAFTEDGWFRTKDLGVFDKDGWLFIKGRTNNTILGPSGENIYPEEIESIINSHDYVSESIVTEDQGRLKALVHFNSEKLEALLASKDEFARSAQEKIDNLKKEIMEYVNEKVSKFSKISDVTEQKEEFEKTATQKIKRYLYKSPNENDRKKSKK